MSTPTTTPRPRPSTGRAPASRVHAGATRASSVDVGTASLTGTASVGEGAESLTSTARGSRGDAGTMSLELVLLTPVLVAFMMLMVGLGRIVEAQSQVDGAARDAARAASVARDRGNARVDADNAAKATMSGTKWCRGGPRTDPDFRDWRQGGQVSVTVRCDIDLGGLSLIGLGASKTMVGTATAPLDTLRRID